jgi:hypothetical protein
MSKWYMILMALGLAGAVAGCQHGRDRILRQEFVEEFQVPPKDDQKFDRPATYPEQKRKLPGPKLDEPRMGPTMRGPAGAPGGAGTPY